MLLSQSYPRLRCRSLLGCQLSLAYTIRRPADRLETRSPLSDSGAGPGPARATFWNEINHVNPLIPPDAASRCTHDDEVVFCR